MFLKKLIVALKIFRSYQELSKSILRVLKRSWSICLSRKLPERFHLHLLVIWVVCHVQSDFVHKEASHQQGRGHLAFDDLDV